MEWSVQGLMALLMVTLVRGEDVELEQVGPGRGFFGDFGSERLAFYAPVSEYVEDEVCRAHSRSLVQGLRDKEHWALKMLDASSKLPDGILLGNLVHLGNYDECLSVENVPHHQGVFSGRHCTVSLGSGYFSKIFYAKRMGDFGQIRNLSGRLGDLSNDVHAIIREFGATVAVCIPSTCSHLDLERHLRSEMRRVLKDVSVSVGEFSCSSRADETHLTVTDWLAILVVLTLITLIVAGTFSETVLKKSGNAASLLEAFSLYENVRGLLKTRPPSDDQLACLDFLRVCSAVAIFYCHYCAVTSFVPSNSLANISEHTYDWLGCIFLTAVFVDCFLLLSGLLLAYNYLKDRASNKQLDLVHFYRHRLIRLTPCYVAVVLLTATLVVYMGDGPLWKPNLIPASEGCQKEGIFALLNIHNYYPVVQTVMGIKCATEGWYLSVDMQLYWLSPLLLYPLWRWPRQGKLLLLTLICSGLAIAFAVPYMHQYRFSVIPTNSTYMTTHTRFTPWLMGVALGCLLHATRGRTYTWLRAGWLLGFLIMAAAMYPAPFLVRPDHVYNRMTTSLYICLMRPMFALGCSLIVLSCARGPNSTRLNGYFSARLIQVLSRLCYSFYVIQWTVIRQFNLTKRNTQHFTDLSLFLEENGVLIITFAAAFVLYVSVEAPTAALEKMLSKKHDSKLVEKSQ